MAISNQHGLTVKDVRNVLVGGFKSSFLTFHDRAQLVRQVQNEMDEIIGKFATRDLAAPHGARLQASGREAGVAALARLLSDKNAGRDCGIPHRDLPSLPYTWTRRWP